MQRIKYIIIFLICLLIFAPVLPASTNASEEWEKALYLSERDRTRLFENIEMFYWQDDLDNALSEYQAELDYSRAFIRYRYSYYDWSQYYEKETDTVSFYPNYDGLPDLGMRYIVVPSYHGDKLIGEIEFTDWNPYDRHEICTPNPDYPCGVGGETYMTFDERFIRIRSEIDEWQYIKKGYDILSVAGLNVEIILCNTDNRVLFKTDKGYYVYPAYNTAEPEKGNQAMPLDEFIRAVYMGQIPYEPVFVTPEPTPTPTPTPRPSRTAAVTPSPTVVTPTATPSAGGITAPALTAAAFLFPSSSSAPEQYTGSTVLIVIGAALVIAAAGAVGWAVFRKKKGKE